MEQVTVAANAKLNLTLDITGRRPDGYHTVEMIMQSVSLHDTITVIKNGSGVVSLQTNCPDIPEDGSNLAVKAAKAFFEAADIGNTGIHIKIEKRIPVAAGLAGGSADAAGVLTALNSLFACGLPLKNLQDIGTALGADIPFCLQGSTMLAQGIGEKLSALPPMPRCPILIVKPNEKVSTAGAYSRFDETGAVHRPDAMGMALALKTGRIGEIAGKLANVFEEVMNLDSVKQIKEKLSGCGAAGTAMSGSGPSVFALFEDEDAAGRCLEAMKPEYGDSYLCCPEKFGCRIMQK